MFLSTSIRPWGEAETANSIRILEMFFYFVAIRVQQVPMWKGSLNLSIYHHLGNTRSSWSHHPRGLPRTHICSLFWGVWLGIRRKSWAILHFRASRPCSSFNLVWETGHSLENNLWCVDCSVESYGFCINPNRLSHSTGFKTKDTHQNRLKFQCTEN